MLPEVNVLFSKVPDQFIEEAESYFVGKDNTKYYYSLDFDGEGDVVLKDTCGRSVPLAFEDLFSLASACEVIVDTAKPSQHDFLGEVTVN